MKILVIDDTKKHLDAALQTLVGHEVTVCDSHDKAVELLRPQYNNSEMERLLTKYRADGVENPYSRAQAETALPYWDAVLCDLLMPAGRNTQGTRGMEFVGKEMPVGWALALNAAIEGAKYVAVVTDLDHHSHPASAMLDPINGQIFQIDGAKLMMTNHVNMVGVIGTECSCKECNGSGKKQREGGSDYECYRCNGTGQDFAEKGKDWNAVLAHILKGGNEER